MVGIRGETLLTGNARLEYFLRALKFFGKILRGPKILGGILRGLENFGGKFKGL